MANRLSNSQITKYSQCGMSYKLHYIDKIRPSKLHSALLFGSAFDTATQVLLEPEKHKGKTAEEVFSDSWTYQDIDGVRTYIPDNITLVYANSDFDADLVMYAMFKETKEEILTLVSKRKDNGYNNLGDVEKALVNKIFWSCLQKKGLLFIKAFREQVLPKVTKVHSTQEAVELSNGEDTVTGFIDAVLEWEGYYHPIVTDFKTSSMKYEEDSVATSQQLSLYCNAVSEKYNTDLAAYIVFNKNIIKNRKKICSKCKYDGSGKSHKTCPNELGDKRCNSAWDETLDPQVFVQVIISAIPDRTTEIVLENFDEINKAIKAEIFPRNLAVCGDLFGRPCPYKGYCFKNDMEGLTKKS